MLPSRAADGPLTNAQLFALPSMAEVARALDADFGRYVERHKGELPNESIGVSTGLRLPAVRPRATLFRRIRVSCSPGIVNRMDRAYVAPERIAARSA